MREKSIQGRRASAQPANKATATVQEIPGAQQKVQCRRNEPLITVTASGILSQMGGNRGRAQHQQEGAQWRQNDKNGRKATFG